MHVETADEAAAGCPGCGVVSTSVKEVRTAPKDIPYGKGRHRGALAQDPVALPGGLLRSGLVHRGDREVPARMRTTGRLRPRWVPRSATPARSGGRGRRAYAVSWPTAHRAFVAHADTLLAEPEPVRVLGIDETRRGKPRWSRAPHRAGGGVLIRRTPGSSIWTAIRGCWGSARGAPARRSWTGLREQRRVPGGDRVRGDRPGRGLRQGDPHPGAAAQRAVVVDHFHLTKLANDAVTKVRRRVIWEQHDRRGRKVDPAWANRRRLLPARERLSAKGFTKMWNAI